MNLRVIKIWISMVVMSVSNVLYPAIDMPDVISADENLCVPSIIMHPVDPAAPQIRSCHSLAEVQAPWRLCDNGKCSSDPQKYTIPGTCRMKWPICRMCTGDEAHLPCCCKNSPNGYGEAVLKDNVSAQQQ